MAVAPTLIVDKDRITISADIAWFNDPLPPGSVLIQGTPLAGQDSLAASYDGVQPIIWSVPIGEYSITAYGYPDNRMQPQRPEAVLDAVVVGPTRQMQITAALLEYAQRQYQTQMALETLQTLVPTRQELRDAIITP